MTSVESDPLVRIAEALERLAPPPRPLPDFKAQKVFVWHAEGTYLQAVDLASIDLDLLLGFDAIKQTFMNNMTRFLRGHPANHVLLWGARGTGKSSLVKAAFASLQADYGDAIIIEILREDIASLQTVLSIVLNHPQHTFVLFCDDLSFEADDIHYKSLKALLDGGLAGQPDNLLFCATSNRRHLMQRSMIENEQSTAINPSEAVEEKVSLSDRFGLWLGFHATSQPEYLEMVKRYASHFDIDLNAEALRAQALAWAQTRGARSGRVAWQFIQSLR